MPADIQASVVIALATLRLPGGGGGGGVVPPPAPPRPPGGGGGGVVCDGGGKRQTAARRSACSPATGLTGAHKSTLISRRWHTQRFLSFINNERANSPSPLDATSHAPPTAAPPPPPSPPQLGPTSSQASSGAGRAPQRVSVRSKSNRY